jgi:hypothetical protein
LQVDTALATEGNRFRFKRVRSGTKAAKTFQLITLRAEPGIALLVCAEMWNALLRAAQEERQMFVTGLLAFLFQGAHAGRGAVVLGLHGAELGAHLAQFHQHHFNPAFQSVIAVIDPPH